MTDFSKAYDGLTDQVNNYVSSISTDWKSIPGGLSKVVSSSMGFAWGIGINKLYYSRLPSNGQWDNVPLDDTPIDIAADESHIYVLGSSKLMIKSANNLDEWIVVNSQSGATQIFVTGSYIWIQDSTGKKWKLAKPGTTGNWMDTDDMGKITSANAYSLYGVDTTGNPMKTDEALQSGWSIVPEMQGSKYSKVIGDIDKTALYGIDTKNGLQRCTDESCDLITTNGLTPQNLNVNPSTNTLWMTTTTPGELGTIFTKQDSLNKNDFLSTLDPLDKQRTDLIQSAQSQKQSDEKISALSEKFKQIRDFLYGILKSQPKIDTSGTEKEIIDNQSQLDQFTKTEPILMKILFYLSIATILYLLFGFLGFIGNLLVLGVLGYGIYDVYFLYKKQ